MPRKFQLVVVLSVVTTLLSLIGLAAAQDAPLRPTSAPRAPGTLGAAALLTPLLDVGQGAQRRYLFGHGQREKLVDGDVPNRRRYPFLRAP